MSNRKVFVRAIAAVAVAAACAMALDAVVVLADAPPATQPAAGAPSTQPVLVGGSITNEYARPTRTDSPPPTLMSSPNGGSSANVPSTVAIGGGVDAGKGNPAPPMANSGLAPVPTTRPAR